METALPLLVQQMLEPSFYPHPVASVQLIQTHASYVFLTGTYAYKIKKPVNFGFMDYSTLEKRKFYLHEELRLNQRLAPAIYETILSIVQVGEHYQWGTEATEAVEYVLRMVEFPQSNLLSQLFDTEGVTLAHVENLGRQVAEFHQKAQVNDYIRAFGWRVREPIDQNYEQTVAFIGTLQTLEQYDQTKAFTDQFFVQHRELLQQRVQEDKIRECHGDLHLGNICLMDQEPVIFDCIEFNEPFRFIDVCSDIAFLVMDLIARQRPDLANRFLNIYLEWTGDWASITLLPVYLSYRAYVRAKVSSFMFSDPMMGPEQRKSMEQNAQSYYHLAWQFTQPRQPKLYIMQGLSGSGKSTVAKALALQTEAIHLRSDAVRKHLAGWPLLEKLPDEYYTLEFSERTYEQLVTFARLILRAGFSVILDAKYDRVAQRQPILALAKAEQVTLKVIACRCAETTLIARLNQRTGDIADADASLLTQQKQTQEEFTPDEQDLVLFVNTEAALDYRELV